MAKSDKRQKNDKSNKKKPKGKVKSALAHYAYKAIPLEVMKDKMRNTKNDYFTYDDLA